MADRDWSKILFDPPEGSQPDPNLIEAQSPVERPAPVARPGDEAPVRRAPSAQPRPAPQAPAQASPPAARKWDELIVGTPPAAAPAAAAAPFPGYKDPKEEGWGEWLGNTVKGRQDPRTKDLPSLERQLIERRLYVAPPFDSLSESAQSFPRSE